MSSHSSAKLGANWAGASAGVEFGLGEGGEKIVGGSAGRDTTVVDEDKVTVEDVDMVGRRVCHEGGLEETTELGVEVK